MEKIKGNLIKVGSIIIEKIKELMAVVDQRQQERVYYDHYRTKLTKMQKPGGEQNSANAEDQEKYARN